jgi:hypothetical protein
VDDVFQTNKLTKSVLVLTIILGGFAWWVPNAEAKRGDGIIFFASPSNVVPQVKLYTKLSNSFSATSNSITGTQPVITQIKSSPYKNEYIAGYEDALGNLQIMCYDGASWRNEWSTVVGGTATTRRFDIAFETSTGDVTVAYSRNSASVNGLAYRYKAGSTACGSSNWSAANNFPTVTSTTTGVVQWVKAARDGRASSNLSTFVWADSNSDLGSAVWSGTAFGNFRLLETSLEVIATAQDVDDFEVQYESNSGDVMVVWANSSGNNGTMGGMFDTCNGGTASCSWGTSAKMWTTIGDDATVLDLSSDPKSDRMAFSSIGNAGSDLQAGYWDGSAWTKYPNLDTSCETPASGMRLTQTGWVTNNGHTSWIITYDDSTGTGLSWYSAIPGSTPVKQTDFTTSPAINDIRERYQIDNNPFDDSTFMLNISDSTKKVISEQLDMNPSGVLTWSNASAPSGVATITSVPAEGFSFTYDRYTGPQVLSFDIVGSDGSSVSNPSVTMATKPFEFSCGSSYGTLGTSSQLLHVVNTTTNPAWSLSLAATSGNTALWNGSSGSYDFNDQSGSPPGCSAGTDSDSYAGLLDLVFATANITPDPTCSSTGLSLGTNSGFSEGRVDAITIANAGTSAETECSFNLTGIALHQTIPSEQPAGTYQLNMTLTLVAN